MKRLSLFQKYALSLAVLVTVPIVGVGIIEMHAVYEAASKAAQEGQLIKARQAAFLVEAAVLPAVERLARLADLPWNYPTATPERQRTEFVRLISQFALFERIQRVKVNGDVLQSTAQDGRPRALSVDEIKRIGAHERCASDIVQRPLIVVGEGSRSWSLAYAERGTNDRLVADLRTSVINDPLPIARGDGQTVVMIIDAVGTILAHSDLPLSQKRARLNDLQGWEDSSRILSASLQRQNCGQSKGRQADPKEGVLGELAVQALHDAPRAQKWFVAYRTIPALEWAVVAMVPSATLNAQILDSVARLAMTLLLANAVALVIAGILARQLSQPLSSLTDASQRVAQGDLTARAQKFADDDIGRLSTQFNSMVTQLESSYSELERRVAEKTSALELANRHKSEFLAQMSHELRTPLNAVLGYADALKAQWFGALNEQQQQYVDQVRLSARHLLALINDLLDLAKIEAGRMGLEASNIDLESIVDAALAMVTVRAEAKGLDMSRHVDLGQEQAVADERKLKQILMNLLSNAVKFTPRNGAIRVTVEHISTGHRQLIAAQRSRFVPIPEADIATLPDGWLVSVSDTGIGIPADKRQTLFTDFGPIGLESEASEGSEGTGLGLAVSQRLAALHQMEIRVESVEGFGSTFWFVLPAKS